jgi:HrpA-like RNA helicase
MKATSRMNVAHAVEISNQVFPSQIEGRDVTFGVDLSQFVTHLELFLAGLVDSSLSSLPESPSLSLSDLIFPFCDISNRVKSLHNVTLSSESEEAREKESRWREREEEAEVLESIFNATDESRGFLNFLPHGWALSLSSSSSPSSTQLFFLFPEESEYPKSVPLLLITASHKIGDAGVIQSFLQKLYTAAKEMSVDGEPFAYQLHNIAMEELSKLSRNTNVPQPSLSSSCPSSTAPSSSSSSSSSLSNISKASKFIEPLISVSDTPSLASHVSPSFSRLLTASEMKGKKVIKNSEEISAVLKNELVALTNRSDYQKLLDVRKRLPSFGRRDALLKQIDIYSVTVITGSTGCGKSTQIPQVFESH